MKRESFRLPFDRYKNAQVKETKEYGMYIFKVRQVIYRTETCACALNVTNKCKRQVTRVATTRFTLD